ncbi:MAG: carbamoyltransferase HypF, partial [Kiritimatiellia bacterium]
DMHPDYMATRFALSMHGVKRISVQHHHAHIASCIAEHNLAGKVIGLALDGTGYGDDGTIWGGEILVADLKSYRRVGHFKQYRLPGGDASALHPARMAASIITAEFGAEAQWIIRKHLPSINDTAAGAIMAMVASGVNSPMTSSAGRLFDAVSALLGFSVEVSYEGQAAVRLQAMADGSVTKHYPYEMKMEQGILVISFAPAIRAIITGLGNKTPPGEISGRFHNTIVAALATACIKIRGVSNLNTVALSGGVFQNDLLVQKLIPALKKNRFDVYINQSVPPNDGGIAIGQAAVAAARYLGRSVNNSACNCEP